MELSDRIVIDANIHHGAPVIAGSRVPVALLVGSLAGGMTRSEISKEYNVADDDISAALTYAAELIEETSVQRLAS